MPNFFNRLFSKKEKVLSKGDLYDVQTEQIIKQVCKKDSNCVDAGCNIGDILKIILKYAPDGRHYAYEPIPDLFQQLQAKFGQYQNCHISDIALSDKKGTSSFNYVVSNPAYSGLIKRKYDKEGEVDTLIEVQTNLLDDILPKDYRVDLIKIDVEGGEFPLLRGAANTLKKYKPVVIFEHGTGASEFYGTRPEDLYHFLRDCGLEVYTLTKWLGKQPPLSVEELVSIFNTNEEWYFVASVKV
ncbi:FkbM family methyltransferase [Chitinophaga arvensicola]|uniref:Methyltransferase, FkbM family n=1 Tax=Chitinophaga arvensicola TaxID=29529 RepID=A0A1I0PFL7_9BACT|nr:FkbM family methyltransferase [Chitinophaga arvensicola]SEW13246.1 methyltransferase, FkbM family [Chitinophaga arvensicola]